MEILVIVITIVIIIIIFSSNNLGRKTEDFAITSYINYLEKSKKTISSDMKDLNKLKEMYSVLGTEIAGKQILKGIRENAKIRTELYSDSKIVLAEKKYLSFLHNLVKFNNTEKEDDFEVTNYIKYLEKSIEMISLEMLYQNNIDTTKKMYLQIGKEATSQAMLEKLKKSENISSVLSSDPKIILAEEKFLSFASNLV